jgi:hypothetical protein
MFVTYSNDAFTQTRYVNEAGTHLQPSPHDFVIYNKQEIGQAASTFFTGNVNTVNGVEYNCLIRSQHIINFRVMLSY